MTTFATRFYTLPSAKLRGYRLVGGACFTLFLYLYATPRMECPKNIDKIQTLSQQNLGGRESGANGRLQRERRCTNAGWREKCPCAAFWSGRGCMVRAALRNKPRPGPLGSPTIFPNFRWIGRDCPQPRATKNVALFAHRAWCAGQRGKYPIVARAPDVIGSSGPPRLETWYRSRTAFSRAWHGERASGHQRIVFDDR